MTDPRQRAAATKRERTRRALIRAATVLFDKQGYEATSIEDIATRAGVGVATAYNYFSTKDQLPAYCLSPLLDELAESAEHDVAVSTDIHVGVERHVTDAARILHQHRRLVVGFMTAYTVHQDSSNVFSRANDLEVWDKLAEPLEALVLSASPGVLDYHMKALVLRVVARPSEPYRKTASFVLDRLLPEIKTADA